MLSIANGEAFVTLRFITLLLLSALGCLATAQSVDQGVAMYRQHRFLEAEKILRKAVTSQPDNLQAYEAFALTLAGRKLSDDAETELGRAVALGLPADRTRVVEARIALSRRDRGRALELLQEALAINPSNPDAYQTRGMLRANAHDYTGAAQDAETALELRTGDPYDRYYAAVAYNGLGRRDKTIENLRLFMRQAPASPDFDRVEAVLKVMR